MNSDDILVKTEQGMQAVRQRSEDLPQRLRTVLIQVDGRVPVQQMQTMALKSGAPVDALQILLDRGLVAVRPSRGSSGGVASRHGELAPRAAPVVAAPAPAAVPAVVPALAPAAAPAAAHAERFEQAQLYLINTAAEVLGVRALFLNLKLEKCATGADLQALMPDYLRAVTKAKGEATARDVQTRVRELLG